MFVGECVILIFLLFILGFSEGFYYIYGMGKKVND